MRDYFGDFERTFNYVNKSADRAREALEIGLFLEEDREGIQKTLHKLDAIECLVDLGHGFSMKFSTNEYLALNDKLWEQVQTAVKNKAKELEISCRVIPPDECGSNTIKTQFTPFPGFGG